MYLKEFIDEEKFKDKKQKLEKKKVKLEKERKELENDPGNEWIDETKEAFEFCTQARAKLVDGDKKDRRKVLKTLGRLNCTLEDEKLALTSPIWLQRVKEIYPEIQARKKAFELENYPENKPDFAEKQGLKTLVRGRPDLNRRSRP